MKIRRFLLLLALPATIVMTSCEKSKGPDAKILNCDENPTFTLNYGETVKCGDWSVAFTGDVQDSRCPTSVTCVWEGRVDVELQVGDELISLGLPDSAELGRSRDTVDNKIVELLEVLPVPVTADAIPKENYRVKLQVSDLN